MPDCNQSQSVEPSCGTVTRERQEWTTITNHSSPLSYILTPHYDQSAPGDNILSLYQVNCFEKLMSLDWNCIWVFNTYIVQWCDKKHNNDAPYFSNPVRKSVCSSLDLRILWGVSVPPHLPRRPRFFSSDTRSHTSQSHNGDSWNGSQDTWEGRININDKTD